MHTATQAGVPDTLLVVPGLMSGVSLHNPFHLLHSTVPLAWQLHHPSYGLCVPRDELDVRLAFFNAFHGKRSAHFWRVFTNPRKAPISGEDLEQRFNIAATWRFWWGPLASRLPMPFGADAGPKCYRRIVFGRELFRTGLGGFGTPRVMSFYHRYLADVLRGQDFRRRPPSNPSSEPVSDDAEWSIFERMSPAAPHEDFLSLWEFERKYATPFFTPEGAQRIRQPPFRMWKAEGSLATTSAGGPMPVLGPDARVNPRLVHSRGAGPRQQLRLLLVQRPKGAGRWIANLEDVVRWAEAWQHPRASLALLVADLGEMHPAAQWQLASQAHILVGVTGAALAWAAFLPRGGVVLDVFPPASHFCTEGWDRNPVSHYGGLARLAGVQHVCMVHPAELQGPPREGMTPEQQALLEVREKLGGLWHGQDVRLDMPKFQRFFEEGVERALGALASP